MKRYLISTSEHRVRTHSMMNRSELHLLDLPDEILLIILKKLDNIDVLYSLFGINNYRLHHLVQEDTFTNTLNFVLTSTNQNCSVSHTILDRFFVNVLPKIHHHVKCLSFESSYIEHVLANDYPNLRQLKLVNFNKNIASKYFKGKYSCVQ